MKIYNTPEMDINVIKSQDIIAVSNIHTLINGGEEGIAKSESFAYMFDNEMR